MKKFQDWIDMKEAALPVKKFQYGKKVVIIMRGIPGGGKSYTTRTLLNRLGGDANHVFSTDNAYIPDTLTRRAAGAHVPEEEEKAEYNKNWNPEASKKAHINNVINFKKAVDQGVTPIIVDNTNIEKARMAPYVRYARDNDYEIRFQEPTSEWWQQYSPYLADKQLNADKLEEFSKLLYTKNTHGVPLGTIRDMIKQWYHNPKVEDILGENPKDKK